MSREKHKVTKLMSPENTPSENLKLAQVGEFWGTTEFVHAWHWRFMLALCSQPEASKLKRTKAATTREIGKVVGKAIVEGDWRYLNSLAKAVEFVSTHFDWKVKEVPGDFMALSHFDISKFKPVDKLRALIVRDYFLTRGECYDKARHSRKAFMKHIKSLMPRSYQMCERTFDRACKEAGIGWQKKKAAASKRRAKT